MKSRSLPISYRKLSNVAQINSPTLANIEEWFEYFAIAPNGTILFRNWGVRATSGNSRTFAAAASDRRMWVGVLYGGPIGPNRDLWLTRRVPY